MYPFLKDDVVFGTFQREGSDELCYFFRNPSGDEYEVDRELFLALINADGTKPLNLPDEGKNLLPTLIQSDLVQTSRFVRMDGILNRWVLFPLGSRIRRYRRYFKIINCLLPAISIFCFIVGIWLFWHTRMGYYYDFNIWLYVGLYILSIVLHEIGHLAVGVAYDYRMSEIGIILCGVFPCGAYVACIPKGRIVKRKQIQFYLAGIEMNLLITGVSLILSSHSAYLASTLVSVANVNVLLIIVNLLPTLGMDGESVLSILCEVSDIKKMSQKWLFTPELREKLIRAGWQGYVYILFFCFVYISKYLVVLILVSIQISIFLV